MHFRVKEIQGTATIIRKVDNKIKLEVGDFFYPDELATLEVSGALVYWNDKTGEVFTASAVEPAEPAEPTEPAEPAEPATVEGPGKAAEA